MAGSIGYRRQVKNASSRVLGWRMCLIALATLIVLPACSDPKQESGDTRGAASATAATGSHEGELVGHIPFGSHPVFTRRFCLAENFSLALALPENATPPEVRFYCAAPWKLEAFAGVQSALRTAGVDVIGATVRASPPAGRAVLQQSMQLAESQADAGPPGMGALWKAYHFLPFLAALRSHSADEAVIVAHFDRDDVQKMRRASGLIDWRAPAVDLSVARGDEVTGLASNPTLSDASAYILTLAQ